MRYRIFSREIYKNRKTAWKDTEEIIEADKASNAMLEWLDKYSPAVLAPEGYGVGSTYVARNNYVWQELRDFGASYRYPEDEYFSLELKARRVK